MSNYETSGWSDRPDYSFNQLTSYDENYLPIGTGWPFTASNLSPITTGGNSNDIGAQYERTIFPGLSSVSVESTKGRTNYNALNFTLNKRVTNGLAVSLTYTYSKAMAMTGDTIVLEHGNTNYAGNAGWNYGRSSADRTHNASLAYNYRAARRLTSVAALLPAHPPQRAPPISRRVATLFPIPRKSPR